MQKHRSVLVILLSVSMFTVHWPASAQFDDQSEFDAQKQSLAEKVLDLRLSDLPPTQQNIYSEDGSELLVRAGTPPENFLTPFDMGWETLTIDDIERMTGEDIKSRPVSSFPGLYDFWYSESKRRAKENMFATLSKPWRILMEPAIAQTTPPPSAVVPINSLPGIGNVQLQTITGPLGNPNPAVAGAASTTASGSAPPISIYPALASMPLLSTILSVKDYFIPMDVAYTGGKFSDAPCDKGIECKEAPTVDNATSGIWKKPFASCTPGKADGDDCGHFEVRRRGGEAAQVHIRWMTKRHKESEGNFLCTKGPVGRHPFGDNPRYVAQSISENGNIKKVNPFPSGDAKAEAKFWLYFYVVGPDGLKSANCFGVPAPPPIDKAVEGGLVLHGLDKGSKNAAIQSLISGVQNPGQSSGGGGGTPPKNLPPPTDCPPGDRSFGWPANGTFTSGYGWRWGRMHWGIDVANNIGTPVVASLCGRLVFNQWDDSGFGNLYVVDHGNGWETFYAHNDSPSKLPLGSVVKRGQFLGFMGSSGRSTGPHTHFEIRHNGARLNPMDFLR